MAVLGGNLIEVLSNPNVFQCNPYWELGILAIPVTVIWIVAITNAVNLIDGLDGLACGVSTISSMTLLVIALVVGRWEVAILMAALAGACIGFLPYNMNPAKIFMGDTGSTFLGFILAVVSIQGLFKFHTIISFAVPFLMLGLPIFDTCFAFIRRIAHGQSPMHAGPSHVHHRLIDMGFNQKQAVAVLYIISAILGLSAVVSHHQRRAEGHAAAAGPLRRGCGLGPIFLGNNEKARLCEEDPETDWRGNKPSKMPIRSDDDFRHPAGGHQDGPLVLEFERRGRSLRAICCVTRSTGEMLDCSAGDLQLQPQYDLNIMEPRQTLSTITVQVPAGHGAGPGAGGARTWFWSTGIPPPPSPGPWRPFTTRSRWAMWRRDCAPMTSILPFRRR